MSSRKDAGSGCDGLKVDLEKGRSHRESMIRTCLGQTENFISYFAEESVFVVKILFVKNFSCRYTYCYIFT